MNNLAAIKPEAIENNFKNYKSLEYVGQMNNNGTINYCFKVKGSVDTVITISESFKISQLKSCNKLAFSLNGSLVIEGLSFTMFAERLNKAASLEFIQDMELAYATCIDAFNVVQQLGINTQRELLSAQFAHDNSKFKNLVLSRLTLSQT